MKHVMKDLCPANNIIHTRISFTGTWSNEFAFAFIEFEFADATLDAYIFAFSATEQNSTDGLLSTL